MSTTTVHTPDPHDDDHGTDYTDRENDTGMPDATIVPMPRRDHGPEHRPEDGPGSQPGVVDGEVIATTYHDDDNTDDNTDDASADENGDSANGDGSGEGVRVAVPVDLPERSASRSLDVRVRDAVNGERRSVVAPWLRSRTEFTNTAKWAADYAAHVTAFHAVRLPLYASKLALRAVGCVQGVGVHGRVDVRPGGFTAAPGRRTARGR